MENSNGRDQQPDEVMPVAPVLPEVNPELIDPPAPADVPEMELPMLMLPVVALPVHELEEVALKSGIVIVELGD